MSNSKILIIGDYHLNKTKYCISCLEQLTFDDNTKWVCSKWASIKSAKKEYIKYKKEVNIPDIVILSVGNNDLTKVSTYHCIITSLLRLVNFLHHDKVKAVVLFSLVQRACPISLYNEQVNKINHVLECKSKEIEWLFYFPIWVKTYSKGVGSLINGYHLSLRDHVEIAKLISGLRSRREIAKLLMKENNIRAISQISDQHSNKQSSSVSKKSASLKNKFLLPELEKLKGKLTLMEKEKEKTEEYLDKLSEGISSLDIYIDELEQIT